MMNVMESYQMDRLEKLGVMIAKNQPIPHTLIINVPERSPDGKLSAEEIVKDVESTLNKIITGGQKESGIIKIKYFVRKGDSHEQK